MTRREQNQNTTEDGLPLSESLNRAWNELSNANWDEMFTSANRKLDDVMTSLGSRMDEYEANHHHRWHGWGRHRKQRRINSLEYPEGVECKDYAYPVPSVRQHARCVENGGVGAWDRQGMWNCLVGDTKKLGLDDKQLGDDRSFFRDYSVYLDWKTAMKKASDARKEQEKLRWQQQASQWNQTVDNNVSRHEGSIMAPARSEDVTKYVSETEATANNKRIVNSNVINEYVYRDGELKSRSVVKKWYEDGTMSVTESINGHPSKDSGPVSSGTETGSSGWFWK